RTAVLCPSPYFSRYCLPLFFSFFFSSSAALRHLHSFPTRRSSDLLDARREPRVGSAAGEPHAAARRAAEEMDRRPLEGDDRRAGDRKSTRLNSSHVSISYAVFCLKKKKKNKNKKQQHKLNNHNLKA